MQYNIYVAKCKSMFALFNVLYDVLLCVRSITLGNRKEKSLPSDTCTFYFRVVNYANCNKMHINNHYKNVSIKIV